MPRTQDLAIFVATTTDRQQTKPVALLLAYLCGVTREYTACYASARLWLSWFEYRATTTRLPVPTLAVPFAIAEDLQYLLICFIHEAQRKNGLECPPTTSMELCITLAMTVKD